MRASVIGAVAAVLVGLCTAEGAIVELALPCAGRYDWQTPSCTVDFDLGVQFSEISHVYIQWSGQIAASVFAPQDDSGRRSRVEGEVASETDTMAPAQAVDVGIVASLGSNPYLRSVTIWGGQATYPQAEPFQSLSEVGLVGTSTWSDLLDGKGTISVGYTETMGPYGAFLEHGYVVLGWATLTVDGSAVPEPATLGLLVGGVLLRRIGRGGLNEPLRNDRV